MAECAWCAQETMTVFITDYEGDRIKLCIACKEAWGGNYLFNPPDERSPEAVRAEAERAWQEFLDS